MESNDFIVPCRGRPVLLDRSGGECCPRRVPGQPIQARITAFDHRRRKCGNVRGEHQLGNVTGLHKIKPAYFIVSFPVKATVRN
jgi:hypothetical protein